MAGPNFLLGYGERLTEPVSIPGRPIEKHFPYTVAEALAQLSVMAETTAHEFSELPAEACPGDRAVAVLTLHPEFIAKSYYPTALLSDGGFEALGSRTRIVTPRKWTRRRPPEPTETTEIFVAVRRSDFQLWSEALQRPTDRGPGVFDLRKIERLAAQTPGDRLRLLHGKENEVSLEAVLHASPGSPLVLEAFRAFLTRLEMTADLDQRLYAGRLCFIPIHGERSKLPELAKFSFLRVAREMPRLRPISPPVRSHLAPPRQPAVLPADPPVNRDVRAAIFDGGIPSTQALDLWVERHDVGNIGAEHVECTNHGLSVTSALLFGSLATHDPAPRPYGYIDHYRVLDDQYNNDVDLFKVLHRIRTVLQSRQHQFVSLSIGPDLPIEDDEVHAWTAVLDDLLSNGEVLAAIAVGNNGESDAILGFNRVQVPSDCVNALAVGSASTLGPGWCRAPYSALGPGRSPGLIKPDLLAFGGSDSSPFVVVGPGLPGGVKHVQGTSFAAPSALRVALGVRAHFGDMLSPLAIKALLVHSCEDGHLARREQGWGRIPGTLEDLVVCAEGTARIVYQGELQPAQYLRAQIPLPAEPLNGNVTISATICYATPVDPGDPASYTRSGLEVVFRPHAERFDEESTHATTASFFQLSQYSTEEELRRDAHKWETVLHSTKTKRASSLKRPVFDIHYVPRESGAPTGNADRIKYALVITVESPKTPDLYNRIVHRYRTQLQPLIPLIQIPVRT
jgi:hypothetical protein